MERSDEGRTRRRFLEFLAASPLLAAGGAYAQPPLIKTAGEALNVYELQAVAERTVPPAHYGYLQTGVHDDRTVAANTQGFARWGVRARRLTGVSRPDLTTRLFGETLASPVLLCPIGSQRAFHPDGERAVARAAKVRGALQVLSTVSSTSVAEVARERAGPLWFQVYPTDDFAVTTALVRRAEAAGARAIVLTLDLLDGGARRETMVRLARGDTRPCASCHGELTPRGTGSYLRRPNFEGIDTAQVRSLQATLTWDYVSRVRDVTNRPVLVKGIMSADDAKLAVRRGASGVIVSNHGGRAEESLVPTVEVLPEVVAAVGGRVPVIVDGGVRRGSDVFKALALGARAVGLGRPYVWGLGAFGQEGVETAMRLIDEELTQTMLQAGAPRSASLSRANVQRLA